MGQQIDFAVVKIDCTWSKSLSLTNLTIVDLRPINKDETYNKIASVLDQLSKKWDQREGKLMELRLTVVLCSYATLYRCYFQTLQLKHYEEACCLCALD
jgi:hypothetical protein